MGRPSSYTQEIADSICLDLAEGKGLAQICREKDLDYSTVMKWLRDNEDFSKNYARAREDQADFHADEIISIADTEEDSNKARVRIDARKWVAGKMKPKKYGDSTQIKHADSDGKRLTLGHILGEINGSTKDLPRDEEVPE